jgi:hypothetical protein
MGCNEDRVLALATALGWAADTGVHRCKSMRRRQLECAALKSLRRRFEGCGTAEDRHSAGRGTVGGVNQRAATLLSSKMRQGSRIEFAAGQVCCPNKCLLRFFQRPPPPICADLDARTANQHQRVCGRCCVKMCAIITHAS